MADSKAELVQAKTNDFEPRIVAFFCNWCTYLAADLAGTSRVKYAPNIRVVRTMCSGRVDPQFVLDAFAHGADGVLIGGCHPGDCHYQEGNYKTLRRVIALRPLLREMGIEDERFRLEWISASEAERLKTVVNDMVEKLRALGPRFERGKTGAGLGGGRGETAVPSSAGQPEEAHCSGEIDDTRAGSNAEALVADAERQEAASKPRHLSPVSGVVSSKPRVAFYWCASCGGCDETVLDLDERVLDVVAAVDIVFWPVALDFKRRDLEAMPDGSILAAFVNGAVRNTEQQEMAHLLRKKSKIIVALGSCAQLGGVPGLANLASRQSILSSSFCESPSTVNPENVFPQTQHRVNGFSVSLPELTETVHKLDDVVEVDYYLPGCPPTPEVFVAAVQVLLSGNLPPHGAVLAPDRALCGDCPRQDTRPEKFTLKEIKRPQAVLIDEEKCLLAQGVVCLGPATRSGCTALCLRGNMPCTGCFGPTSRVRDYGGKALSALASIIDSNDQEEIERILQTIPDPVGAFYRYSLPASSLHAKRK